MIDPLALSHKIADEEVGSGWVLLDMLTATLVMANGLSLRVAASHAQVILDRAVERALAELQ